MLGFLAAAVLTWTAPLLNEDGSAYIDPSHYTAHVGCTESGVYEEQTIDNIPYTITTVTVSALPESTCYFVATATNLSGETSAYSGEATRDFTVVLPGAVTDTQIVWQESGEPVMAVSVGQMTVSDSGQSTTTSHDVSFNPGTGDDMVVVAIHYVARGTGYVSTGAVRDPATDNVSMTEITGTNQLGPERFLENVVLYILKDADIDKGVSQTYRFTSSSAAVSVHMYSFLGVDQTTPYDNVQVVEADAADPEENTGVSVSGDLFMDAIINLSTSGGLVPAVAQTAHTGGTIETNGSKWVHTSYRTDSTAPFFSWSWGSQTRETTWIGVNLKAVAAGGGISIPVAYHHQKMLSR